MHIGFNDRDVVFYQNNNFRFAITGYTRHVRSVYIRNERVYVSLR